MRITLLLVPFLLGISYGCDRVCLDECIMSSVSNTCFRKCGCASSVFGGIVTTEQGKVYRVDAFPQKTTKDFDDKDESFRGCRMKCGETCFKFTKGENLIRCLSVNCRCKKLITDITPPPPPPSNTTQAEVPATPAAPTSRPTMKPIDAQPSAPGARWSPEVEPVREPEVIVPEVKPLPKVEPKVEPLPEPKVEEEEPTKLTPEASERLINPELAAKKEAAREAAEKKAAEEKAAAQKAAEEKAANQAAAETAKAAAASGKPVEPVKPAEPEKPKSSPTLTAEASDKLLNPKSQPKIEEKPTFESGALSPEASKQVLQPTSSADDEEKKPIKIEYGKLTPQDVGEPEVEEKPQPRRSYGVLRAGGDKKDTEEEETAKRPSYGKLSVKASVRALATPPKHH